MAELEVLQRLRDQIGNATGPNVALDNALAWFFVDQHRWWNADWRDDDNIAHGATRPLPYTASIDAAFELAKQCLPGWRLAVWETVFGWDAEMTYPESRREDSTDGRRTTFFGVMNGISHRPSGPLAILLALLDALLLERRKADG